MEIKQVARTAGIFAATVSNVLNHPDRIAVDTRASRRVGYRHRRRVFEAELVERVSS